MHVIDYIFSIYIQYLKMDVSLSKREFEDDISKKNGVIQMFGSLLLQY